ncbi:MAG: hypothetical protein AAFY76_11540 [Cyanobacteria bacterium J06649_11]
MHIHEWFKYRPMRYFLLILAILLSGSCFAQDSDNFLRDFMGEQQLLAENILSEVAKDDFSALWVRTDNDLIYGIIGEQYQRIRIKLISVEKNPENPYEYLVVGKSMVKNNICDFKGVIRLEKVQLAEELYHGVDDEMADAGITQQGVLIASYDFVENQEQSHPGRFKGSLYSKWYRLANGVVQYDDLASISDEYMNNAFVGTWSSYHGNITKICNWGDYRVPMAKLGFDVGVAEFYASEAYEKFGWQDQKVKRGAWW